MDPVLNEQQQQLRDSAARLCKDFAGPARQRALRAIGASSDARAWEQIHQAGWPLLLLAEADGGLGTGLLELSLVMLEAGQQLLQASVVPTCAAVEALSQVGDGALLQDLLAQSRPLTAVLIDEGDPYNGGVRLPLATPTGNDFMLQGSVSIGQDAIADTLYLIPARTGQGELLMTAITPSVRDSTPRARIDGSRDDILALDGLHVSASGIVARGAEAVRLHERIATTLRVGTSAALIGVAARALSMTLEHLKTRRQFGQPLEKFQALQHLCVNGFLDLELNRSLLYRTASAWDKGQCHPAMISALKSRTSRAALAITRNAVQMHGAMGYTEDHDIGLYYKRAIVMAAAHGNETHHASRFSALTLEHGARPQSPP